MKTKFVVTALIAASLLSLQPAPASAHEFRHGGGYGHGGYDRGGYGHGGGHNGFFLFTAIGATVAAVATIATLPVRAVADAVTVEPAPEPVYAAQPVAAYPQGGYYSYAPRRAVVYSYPSYPQPAYQPAPTYYPVYQ